MSPRGRNMSESLTPRTTPYRLGLVDDHEIVAVAFSSLIGKMDDVELVCDARTVDDLLALGEHLDLVVLDLRLADGSSPVNNVERLAATGVNVIAFTSGENPFLVRLAAKTAVLGVVRKSEPVAVLEDSLLRAAAGLPVISTDWAAAVDSDPDLDQAGLSPQEQKVLSLFASGKKAQAVAYDAGIALGTVDDYVRRVRAKYAQAHRQVRSKSDMHRAAVEDGFLPGEQGRTPPYS